MTSLDEIRPIVRRLADRYKGKMEDSTGLYRGELNHPCLTIRFGDAGPPVSEDANIRDSFDLSKYDVLFGTHDYISSVTVHVKLPGRVTV